MLEFVPCNSFFVYFFGVSGVIISLFEGNLYCCKNVFPNKFYNDFLELTDYL